jgi:4-amino-4-deoxy-L-arabinose transferase-like glycosyltransferase
VGESGRVRLVAAAAGGNAVFGCYALAQTVLGRGRFDMTPLTTALLAVAVVMLVVPAVWIVARAAGGKWWPAGDRCP